MLVDPQFSTIQNRDVTTYAVNPRGEGGYHCTIQQAIDKAEPYSRIVLAGGTYLESINVTQPLEFIGEDDGDLPELLFRGACITVAVDVECYFENIKASFQGSPLHVNPAAAAKGANASARLTAGRPTFIQCELQSVFVGGLCDPVIRNCNIVSSSFGTGLVVTDEASGLYTMNVIANHLPYCLSVTSRGHPRFTENDIYQHPKTLAHMAAQHHVIGVSRHSGVVVVAREGKAGGSLPPPLLPLSGGSQASSANLMHLPSANYEPDGGDADTATGDNPVAGATAALTSEQKHVLATIAAGISPSFLNNNIRDEIVEAPSSSSPTCFHSRHYWGRRAHELRVGSHETAAVRVDAYCSPVFKENVVSGGAIGVLIGTHAGGEFVDNTIGHAVQYGVVLAQKSVASLKVNTIIKCGTGIFAEATNATLSQNTVRDNHGAGILLLVAKEDRFVLDGNAFVGNDTGIAVWPTTASRQVGPPRGGGGTVVSNDSLATTSSSSALSGTSTRTGGITKAPPIHPDRGRQAAPNTGRAPGTSKQRPPALLPQAIKSLAEPSAAPSAVAPPSAVPSSAIPSLVPGSSPAIAPASSEASSGSPPREETTLGMQHPQGTTTAAPPLPCGAPWWNPPPPIATAAWRPSWWQDVFLPAVKPREVESSGTRNRSPRRGGTSERDEPADRGGGEDPHRRAAATLLTAAQRNPAACVITRCVVSHNRHVGVCVMGGGGPTLLLGDMEISGNTVCGAHVSFGATPAFRNVKFDKGKIGLQSESTGMPLVYRCVFTSQSESAIHSTDHGSGEYVENQIGAFSKSGICTENAGGGYFRLNVVRQSSQGVGLKCHLGGIGDFRSNLVESVGVGCEVSTFADPIMQSNRWVSCTDMGVCCHTDGLGSFVECSIVKCHVGVACLTGGEPTFRQNVIGDCAHIGVLLGAGARGLIEKCTVQGCGSGNIVLEGEACKAVVTRCVVQNSKGFGIRSRKGAEGRVTRNTLTGHREGGALSTESGGRTLFQGNTVVNEVGPGILVMAAGASVFQGNTICSGLTHGVVFLDRGVGSVTGGYVRGNQLGGVLLKAGARGTISHVEIANNGAAGLELTAGASLAAAMTTTSLASFALAAYNGAVALGANDDIASIMLRGATAAPSGVGFQMTPKVSTNLAVAGLSPGATTATASDAAETIVAMRPGVSVYTVIEDLRIVGNLGAGVVIARDAAGVLRRCTISNHVRMRDAPGHTKNDTSEGHKGRHSLSMSENDPLHSSASQRSAAPGVTEGMRLPSLHTGSTKAANASPVDAASALRVARESAATRYHSTATAIALSTNSGCGVVIHCPAGARLEDCTITGNTFGLLGSGGGMARLTQITFEGHRRADVVLTEGARGFVIEDCTMRRSPLGLWCLGASASCLIQKCKLTECTVAGAFVAGAGAQTVVRDCGFDRCLHALVAFTNAQCCFLSCRMTRSFGLANVVLGPQSRVVLDRVSVSRSLGDGVLVLDGSCSVVQGCSIHDNAGSGVRVSPVPTTWSSVLRSKSNEGKWGVVDAPEPLGQDDDAGGGDHIAAPDNSGETSAIFNPFNRRSSILAGGSSIPGPLEDVMPTPGIVLPRRRQHERRASFAVPQAAEALLAAVDDAARPPPTPVTQSPTKRTRIATVKPQNGEPQSSSGRDAATSSSPTQAATAGSPTFGEAATEASKGAAIEAVCATAATVSETLAAVTSVLRAVHTTILSATFAPSAPNGVPTAGVAAAEFTESGGGGGGSAPSSSPLLSKKSQSLVTPSMMRHALCRPSHVNSGPPPTPAKSSSGLSAAALGGAGPFGPCNPLPPSPSAVSNSRQSPRRLAGADGEKKPNSRGATGTHPSSGWSHIAEAFLVARKDIVDPLPASFAINLVALPPSVFDVSVASGNATSGPVGGGAKPPTSASVSSRPDSTPVGASRSGGSAHPLSRARELGKQFRASLFGSTASAATSSSSAVGKESASFASPPLPPPHPIDSAIANDASLMNSGLSFPDDADTSVVSCVVGNITLESKPPALTPNLTAAKGARFHHEQDTSAALLSQSIALSAASAGGTSAHAAVVPKHITHSAMLTMRLLIAPVAETLTATLVHGCLICHNGHAGAIVSQVVTSGALPPAVDDEKAAAGLPSPGPTFSTATAMVAVQHSALFTFTRLTRNIAAGVIVEAKGVARFFHQCLVHENHGPGVILRRHSHALLSECCLTRNGWCNLNVRPLAGGRVSYCDIADGRPYGCMLSTSYTLVTHNELHEHMETLPAVVTPWEAANRASPAAGGNAPSTATGGMNRPAAGMVIRGDKKQPLSLGQSTNSNSGNNLSESSSAANSSATSWGPGDVARLTLVLSRKRYWSPTVRNSVAVVLRGHSDGLLFRDNKLFDNVAAVECVDPSDDGSFDYRGIEAPDDAGENDDWTSLLVYPVASSKDAAQQRSAAMMDKSSSTVGGSGLATGGRDTCRPSILGNHFIGPVNATGALYTIRIGTRCQPRIEGNTFRDCATTAIMVVSGAGGVVKKNDFIRNQTGMAVIGDPIHTRIEANTFELNQVGIVCRRNYGTSLTLKGNVFSENVEAVVADEYATTRLVGNTFRGDKIAVRCLGYAAPRIFYNRFSACGTGVVAERLAAGVLIERNFFDSCELGVMCVAATDEATTGLMAVHNVFSACTNAGWCSAQGSQPARISRNLFCRCKEDGSATCGLRLCEGAGGVYVENDFHTNATAIVCTSSAKGEISRCFIHDNVVGIRCTERASPEVSGCVLFQQSQADLVLRTLAVPLVKDCVFKSKPRCIDVAELGGGVMSHCLVRDSQMGLWVSGPSSLLVTYSTFTTCSVAISITAALPDVTTPSTGESPSKGLFTAPGSSQDGALRITSNQFNSCETSLLLNNSGVPPAAAGSSQWGTLAGSVQPVAVEGNFVLGGDQGIVLESNATNVTLQHNGIVKCVKAGIVVRGPGNSIVIGNRVSECVNYGIALVPQGTQVPGATVAAGATGAESSAASVVGSEGAAAPSATLVAAPATASAVSPARVGQAAQPAGPKAQPPPPLTLDDQGRPMPPPGRHRVTENEVFGSGKANVLLTPFSDAVVAGNRIFGSETGILAQTDAYCFLTGNIAYDCTRAAINISSRLLNCNQGNEYYSVEATGAVEVTADTVSKLTIEQTNKTMNNCSPKMPPMQAVAGTPSKAQDVLKDGPTRDPTAALAGILSGVHTQELPDTFPCGCSAITGSTERSQSLTVNSAFSLEREQGAPQSPAFAPPSALLTAATGAAARRRSLGPDSGSLRPTSPDDATRAVGEGKLSRRKSNVVVPGGSRRSSSSAAATDLKLNVKPPSSKGPKPSARKAAVK